MRLEQMKMLAAMMAAAGTMVLGAVETAAPSAGAPAPAANGAKAGTQKAKRGRPDATMASSRLKLFKKKSGFWWKDRHEQKLAEIKAFGGKIDLVMVGDSITHRWDRAGFGTNVLARLSKTYSILDLGFGADHVEQVLWRITEGGELDGYEAKLVTLMIGTNNSLGYKPENVAAGIRKCVDVIREKQPKAKVVLMAILPRYGDSEEKVKRRACNDAVNAIIKGYADGENVFWLDMNPKFPPVGGDAYKEVCPDSTHPNEKGYEIWAAELQPYLKKYVGK